MFIYIDILTCKILTKNKQTIGEDLLHWNAMLMGPPNTPYDGGVFNVDLVFPAEYPFKPPKVKF